MERRSAFTWRSTPARDTTRAERTTPPCGLTTAGSKRKTAHLRAAGFVVDTVTATEVAGHLDVGADHHHTPEGIVHGGVYARRSSCRRRRRERAVSDRGQFAVGVSKVTNFLRPVTAGRLTVTASAVEQGRTLQLWSVRVVREDGRLSPTARCASRTYHFQPLAAKTDQTSSSPPVGVGSGPRELRRDHPPRLPENGSSPAATPPWPTRVAASRRTSGGAGESPGIPSR